MAENSVASPSLLGDKVIKFYKWTIKDFSSYTTVLESSELIAGTDAEGQLCWNLLLYPKGKGEGSEGYISLFLALNTTKVTEVPAKSIFSILNSKSEKTNTLPGGIDVFTKHISCRGKRKFIKRDILLKSSELLPEGTLTIFCEIHVFGQRAIPIQSPLQIPESSLSDDLGKYLLNEKHSDVTLAVGDQEFPALKIILSVRSDVFAAMFDHDLEESKQNRVTISDVDPEVVREMLHYIYTDKTPNLDKMARELFVAADKYNVVKLKQKCETKLYEQLTVESAVETLILADLHSAGRLKKYVFDFICPRAVDVVQTAGWQNMMTLYPQLLEEACCCLAIYGNTIECCN